MLNVSSACEESRGCPENNLYCTDRKRDDFVDTLHQHFLLGQIFSIYDVMRIFGFRMTEAEQLMRDLERQEKELKVIRDANGNPYFLLTLILDD